MQKTLDETVLSVIDKFMFEPLDDEKLYKAVEEALKLGYAEGLHSMLDMTKQFEYNKNRMGSHITSQSFEDVKEVMVSKMETYSEVMKEYSER